MELVRAAAMRNTDNRPLSWETAAKTHTSFRSLSLPFAVRIGRSERHGVLPLAVFLVLPRAPPRQAEAEGFACCWDGKIDRRERAGASWQAGSRRGSVQDLSVISRSRVYGQTPTDYIRRPTPRLDSFGSSIATLAVCQFILITTCNR